MCLTVSHDPSWANHISKLASKATCRLGILWHTKSFLGTPEHLSSYKAFIHSLEYCSPLWVGIPASHLAQLDTVETKDFQINGISNNEVGPITSLSQTDQWSLSSSTSFLVLRPLLFSCLDPHPSRLLQGTHSPPSTLFG